MTSIVIIILINTKYYIIFIYTRIRITESLNINYFLWIPTHTIILDLCVWTLFLSFNFNSFGINFNQSSKLFNHPSLNNLQMRRKCLSCIPDQALRSVLMKLHTCCNGKSLSEFWSAMEVPCSQEYLSIVLMKNDKKKDQLVSCNPPCSMRDHRYIFY